MDKESLASKLEAYLDSQGDQRTDHRVRDVNEINMGWETELFTFKTSFLENGRQAEADLVLRVFSGDGASGKATREYYLMRLLRELGYPVPPVYHFETGCEVIGKCFIVMRRVMGKTLDATYPSDTPEGLSMGLKKLVELFVRLHKLDSSEFNEVPNLSHIDLDSLLDYYRKFCRDYAPWFAPMVDWIEENRPIDADARMSLCHMDYHGMNVMMEDGEPYVIDWGASLICDYRMDLAWTILLYSTFGGSMFRAPMIELYEGFSAERIEHLEFFEAVGATRRVADMVKTIGGGSAGLRSDVLELMRAQREHFVKVHDFLEKRTGIRFEKLDEILSSF